MTNVYFSASISGGREDVQIYEKIVSFLKNNSFNVLTEHIAKKDINSFEKDNSPSYIYSRDISFIEKSDLVIGECSTPSLGVGYELAYIEKLKKPCYILYNINKSKPLSKMISGNPYFKIYYYKNELELIDNLKNIINDYLKKMS